MPCFVSGVGGVESRTQVQNNLKNPSFTRVGASPPKHQPPETFGDSIYQLKGVSYHYIYHFRKKVIQSTARTTSFVKSRKTGITSSFLNGMLATPDYAAKA